MTDLEFISRCIKGDKQFWNEFVEKYARLIYSFIYSVLKLKGHGRAEDAVNELFQDIFLLLAKDKFKKLKTFKAKNGCSLASWLRQVTVNFTIDYVRKSRLELSINDDTDIEDSEEEMLIDSAPNVADTLISKERLYYLKNCIRALARDDKYFLELHINKGLSLGQLRGYLRVSRGALDMRKRRIIKRLRDCFINKGVIL